MPKSRKILIWLLAILLLAGGLYFFLKGNKTFNLTGAPYFNSFKNINLNEAGTQLKNSAENAISQGTNALMGNIVQGAKEKTFDVIQGGLTAIIKKTGDILGVDQQKNPEVGQTGTSQPVIGQNNNLNSNQNLVSLANPTDENQVMIIRYVIKINQQVSFSIKNPFSDFKNFQYQINWGDNIQENGEFNKGEAAKTISHIWSEEGEKLIKLKILGTNLPAVDSRLYVVISK